MIICGASSSFAQTPPVIVDNYGTICPQYTGFTERIVACIQQTTIWATQRYLGGFNQAFISTVNVMAIFAVLLYGFSLFSGRAQPAARDAFILAIKIGLVIWLVNMSAFSILFPFIIQSIDWLINLVTQYTAIQLGNACEYSPNIWRRVDCALSLLIGGITPTSTVASGLIGFVGALMFSQGFGLALFFFGLAIILAVLMAFFQALFILLSAYIALALLSLMAPIMIPLMLFRITKAYFEKWLRLLIGIILQPIFLFAYLTIFLIALEITLFSGNYSVFRSIACDTVNTPNFKIGDYVNRAGPLGERTGASAIFSLLVGQNAKTFVGNVAGTEAQPGGALGPEATKEAIDDIGLFNNGASISVDVDSTAVDIPFLASICNGQRIDPFPYFVRLLLSMFTAMAVVYIFYSMLQFIPYLGTLISGDLFGLPNLASLFPTNSLTGAQVANRLGFGKGGEK